MQFEVLRIPNPNSNSFQELVQYIETHEKEILAYFPWLTAEMISALGPQKTLKILYELSPRRLQVSSFLIYASGGEHFQKAVLKHCADAMYVELQSATGFFDCIRRHYIYQSIQEGSDLLDIAITIGASVRSVQRHSRQVKQTRHP